MTYGLTYTEAAALAYINKRMAADGIAPSVVEIAIAINYSPKSKGAITVILNALEERGHIHRLKYRTRAIALGPRPSPSCCPHCNRQLEAV